MTALVVGDVGGTSARFGIAQLVDGVPHVEAFRKVPGDDFGRFSEALEAYLKETGAAPRHGLFALAGPVINGGVSLVNRPEWPAIESAKIARQFGLASVSLVNDFAAMARSVPALPDKAFLEVLPGVGQPGHPVLVAGPGTGFGVATILPDGQGWRVVSGEGGHSAYAPRTAKEFAVVEALRKLGHEYVSNELMLSGSSFDDVHQAVCDVHGQPYEPLSPQAVLDCADTDDPVCRDICLLRACGTLGAAGDFTLANGARGGVVIAGGVAQRLRTYIASEEATSRFLNRGPRSDYMENLPVRLLIDEAAPLVGAAALFFENGDVS